MLIISKRIELIFNNMLLNEENPSNLSLIFARPYKVSRERFTKASFEGIICIPNPKQFRRKSPNSKIEIAKKTYILKGIKEIEEKKRYLIKFVMNQRNLFSSRISRFLNRIHSVQSAKKALLINRIIILRTSSVTLIQSYFRTFVTHRHFKEMLNNTTAIFFYNFKYNKGDSIAVTVKRDTIPLLFSRYLRCYYLQIKKKILKRTLKVHFIINGTKIIDSRYAVINDSKGNYYNIIHTSTLFKRVRDRSPKYLKRKMNESKYYEQLFECRRKKSIDCSSVSDRSDISTELNRNMLWSSYTYKKKAELKQVKPILKNSNYEYTFNKHRNRNDFRVKSVSFNNTIELSY